MRGTFLTVRAALPHMISQGGGAIVITASISGMIGEPSLVAYNSSKGRADQPDPPARHRRREPCGPGQCVCPGWIETGFTTRCSGT